MPKKKKDTRKIGALDFETDPFLYGRVPEPFSWGAYTGDDYTDQWDDDPDLLVDKLIQYFEQLEGEWIFYAHNGGKFDFFLMLRRFDVFDEDIKLINGRIAKATLLDGKIELRDSYLILPLALKVHGKDDIDYQKLEANVRHLHKREILAYQRTDVISLYDWVIKFTDQFGRKLTLAGAAFEQLTLTGYEKPRTYESYDALFRQFYYGGRVQCFEVGEIKGDLLYVDINSAYPAAMLQKHPHGTQYVEKLALAKDGLIKGKCNYFAIIKAVSKGALPFRGKDARLYFPTDDKVREYHATGWEIKAGLDTGTLQIKQVVRVYEFIFSEDFSDYVNKWYTVKAEAKQNGDKDQELFAKLMLNSVYGKFGQDGRDFKDFKICDFGHAPEVMEKGDEKTGDKPAPKWKPYAITETNHTIYCCDNPAISFYNVAVAASITGCVRAGMWRAICSSERPLYCDTDSIICAGFGGRISDALGDWSIEGRVKAAYIAQRKMYSVELLDGSWKKACKGVRLEAHEIRDAVINGGVISQKRDAPAFNLKYGPRFLERKTDFENLEKNLLTNPD